VLRYALVGAGAFGTSMLVPQMAKRPDVFFLRGIVSRNTTQGGNFARANQVEVLATELAPVLADPQFDLVVIATRHHEHARQVAQALEAGKHVFVEKPLAITWDELDTVVNAYERTDTPPMLLVGFNRRFSPALQAVGAAVRQRRSPLMINYRLNGGYIPLDSWVQGAQGGGRNLGEACHMYDVFRYLCGAAPVAVSAAAIDPGPLPFLKTDNFSATIRYADGSVATLTYTALGPKTGLPKERIEVFCDGDAFVVDDFKSVTQASSGAVLWQASDADKGHAEEMSRFADALKSAGPSPIPFEEIVETSALALHIDDLLKNAGEGGAE
jgi:predicted dehydrogenase